VVAHHEWTSILGGNANIQLGVWIAQGYSTVDTSGVQIISEKLTNSQNDETYCSDDVIQHTDPYSPFAFTTESSLVIKFSTANIIERTYYVSLYFDVTYEIPQYYVGIMYTASAGSVAGNGTYTAGTTATLTAIPKEGYYVSVWYDDNKNLIAENTDTITVTVTRAITYEPVFSPKYYNISATTSPSVAGTVTGTGRYKYGSEVTLTATASKGWSYSGYSTNTGTNYTSDYLLPSQSITLTVTQDIDYTIKFINNKIYFGTNQPKKIYYGTQPVKGVFYGGTQVYGEFI
jgi:hypothetical protein